jgi:hypothetical protein
MRFGHRIGCSIEKQSDVATGNLTDGLQRLPIAIRVVDRPSRPGGNRT